MCKTFKQGWTNILQTMEYFSPNYDGAKVIDNYTYQVCDKNTPRLLLHISNIKAKSMIWTNNSWILIKKHYCNWQRKIWKNQEIWIYIYRLNHFMNCVGTVYTLCILNVGKQVHLLIFGKLIWKFLQSHGKYKS